MRLEVAAQRGATAAPESAIEPRVRQHAVREQVDADGQGKGGDDADDGGEAALHGSVRLFTPRWARPD